jgi:hypothetical protein
MPHKYFIDQVRLVAVHGIFHNRLLLLSDICYHGGTCALLHSTVMYTAILITGTTHPWSCSFFLWFFISILRQECCDVTLISFRIQILGLFCGLLWVSLCCKEHNLCTDTFNFHQEWEMCVTLSLEVLNGYHTYGKMWLFCLLWQCGQQLNSVFLSFQQRQSYTWSIPLKTNLSLKHMTQGSIILKSRLWGSTAWVWCHKFGHFCLFSSSTFYSTL